MSADRQCVQGFLQSHRRDAFRAINHDNGIDPTKGAVGVPDLLGRSARSLKVNVALMRAFRRSPMEFLDVLVASGARTTPLRMGPERVLLVDDATEVWELLTTHTRRTGKGRGCSIAEFSSRPSTRSVLPTMHRTSLAQRGAVPTGGPTVGTSTSSQRRPP